MTHGQQNIEKSEVAVEEWYTIENHSREGVEFLIDLSFLARDAVDRKGPFGYEQLMDYLKTSLTPNHISRIMKEAWSGYEERQSQNISEVCMETCKHKLEWNDEPRNMYGRCIHCGEVCILDEGKECDECGRYANHEFDCDLFRIID